MKSQDYNAAWEKYHEAIDEQCNHLIRMFIEIKQSLDLFETESFADKTTSQMLRSLLRSFEGSEVFVSHGETEELEKANAEVRHLDSQNLPKEEKEDVDQTLIAIQNQNVRDLKTLKGYVGKETCVLLDEIDAFAGMNDQHGQTLYTSKDAKITRGVIRHILEKGDMEAKKPFEVGTTVNDVDFIVKRYGNGAFKLQCYEENPEDLVVKSCGYSCFTKKGELVYGGEVIFANRDKVREENSETKTKEENTLNKQ